MVLWNHVCILFFSSLDVFLYPHTFLLCYFASCWNYLLSHIHISLEPSLLSLMSPSFHILSQSLCLITFLLDLSLQPLLTLKKSYFTWLPSSLLSFLKLRGPPPSGIVLCWVKLLHPRQTCSLSRLNLNEIWYLDKHIRSYSLWDISIFNN